MLAISKLFPFASRARSRQAGASRQAKVAAVRPTIPLLTPQQASDEIHRLHQQAVERDRAISELGTQLDASLRRANAVESAYKEFTDTVTAALEYRLSVRDGEVISAKLKEITDRLDGNDNDLGTIEKAISKQGEFIGDVRGAVQRAHAATEGLTLLLEDTLATTKRGFVEVHTRIAALETGPADEPEIPPAEIQIVAANVAGDIQGQQLPGSVSTKAETDENSPSVSADPLTGEAEPRAFNGRVEAASGPSSSGPSSIFISGGVPLVRGEAAQGLRFDFDAPPPLVMRLRDDVADVGHELLGQYA